MTSSATAVFITVPKYVAITPSPASPASSSTAALSRIRPLLSAAPASPASSSGYASSGGGCGADAEEGAPKGKKRRLDHLTWEEKIQRKKLKNRVAAQTSRDRKKARMEEMEGEIDVLVERTEILENKCESLQTINDALLEKNQKLDVQVEILRQQLTELQQQQSTSSKQQQQTVASCAGWLNPNGLTVDTSATTKAEAHDDARNALANCCNLPTLQDMQLLLQDVDVGQEGEDDDALLFDAGKLEELAESLLADFAADLEAGDRTRDASAAENAGAAERLSRPVVGTAAERLESSEHSTEAAAKDDSLNAAGYVAESFETEEQMDTETEFPPHAHTETTLQNKFNLNAQVNGNFAEGKSNSATTNTTTPAPAPPLPAATPETVYGTYDARTNSITIVMDDDSVAVNEAVEEIYCDGVRPSDESSIKCPSPASPSQVYLNVVECSDDEDADEDELNFDPIAKFLCPKRPFVSPLAKSPSLHSAANSDHGYESIIGSPSPNLALDHYEIDDFAWNSSFNELFSTLI